jgi:hypothetical protein
MKAQSASKAVSNGICAFCKAEVAKNKITQHLRFCKQRLADIAAQEAKSQETKERLFHILAEGRYNPQYWLHFEVPADGPLWLLDDFLKDMWIDDLDHLSSFTIGDTHYRYEYEDGFFPFSRVEETEAQETEEEEISEEEAEKELRELIDEVISRFGESYADFIGTSLDTEPLMDEWMAELKKPRSLYELIDFLKVELARIEKEDRAAWKEAQQVSPEERRKKYFIMHYRKLIVAKLLDDVEDRSLDVLLERVLKVGQKFFYIYDFGSSTYINLRVIGEREGIVHDEKDPVQLLARNTASAFSCVVCGKPATLVAVGYFTSSIEGSVYCTECADKHVEEGRTLPISNSPRTGVL